MPSGSSVEGPVLESHSPGNAEGFSLAPLSTAGPNADGGTTKNRGVYPPTDRLACLREKFRYTCLSAEVSDLMLASSQTYDSLFN